jgi:hypothetical protein
MSESIKSVRLRVETDEVRLPNTNAPIPKGYYDGHIDLDTDGNMQAVRIILGPRTREVIGMAADASMPCEVLRFMKSGDIREID